MALTYLEILQIWHYSTFLLMSDWSQFWYVVLYPEEVGRVWKLVIFIYLLAELWPFFDLEFVPMSFQAITFSTLAPSIYVRFKPILANIFIWDVCQMSSNRSEIGKDS